MHRKNIRSSSEGTDSSSQIQETEQKKGKKAQTKRDSQKKKLERGDESSITKLLQVLN